MYQRIQQVIAALASAKLANSSPAATASPTVLFLLFAFLVLNLESGDESLAMRLAPDYIQ